MALEGSIKDISLAAIFQLIGMERKTGILTLRTKEEEVSVSMLNGMVVYADSKNRRVDERLGSLLVRTGKISEEQLKKVLKIQKDTLRKMGHILVTEKLIQPEDLKGALQIQITQVIYRLFRWREGTYHFEPETKIEYEKDFFTPMSTESLLMEGMRMIDEWPIIERKIPSFSIVFEKVPVEGVITGPDEGAAPPPAEENEDFDLVFGQAQRPASPEVPSEKIRLNREEQTVYRQVDGESTVREIIDRTMLSEFETCRALYDLINRNLIAPMARAGPKTLEGKRSHKDVIPTVVKALYPVLAVFVLVSPFMMPHNPLNFFTYPLPEDPGVLTIQAEVAHNRLERVSRALRLFRMAEGVYPESLDALVDRGLVSPSDLTDPWGRRLEYERLPSGEALLEKQTLEGPVSAARDVPKEPL